MKVRAIDGARLEERREIVLAGSGGQGLVFLGRLVGEAAARNGLRTVQTQSYGVASRGGFSKSEVIVAGKPIAYPMAMKPWGILALTDQARGMYADSGDGERLLVYDDTYSKTVQGQGEMGFPFISEARRLGLDTSMNMMALGAFLTLRPVVPIETVAEILSEADDELGRTNAKAFAAGVSLARKR